MSLRTVMGGLDPHLTDGMPERTDIMGLKIHASCLLCIPFENFPPIGESWPQAVIALSKRTSPPWPLTKLFAAKLDISK
eukprot:3449190-Amphidinium_carterae.1